MKKYKSISLDEILEEKLKDPEFRIGFNQALFYLRMARLVKELRLKAKLSQAQVALRAGVSQPMIARLEKGDRHRAPTFETIHKILIALGYEVELRAVPIKKLAA